MDLILYNLLSPVILFFVLGVFAAWVKSDLELPEAISKFIALYLLLSIGFKGGQELATSVFSAELVWSVLLGLGAAACIPAYTFFFLKRKLSVQDAGAIAAAYGSVSAVTFIAAVAYLEAMGLTYGPHMVAVMALMEFPAIIVGVFLMQSYDKNKGQSFGELMKHALTNGSVILILGSLIIGFISDPGQAEGIKPFTTDIFKGFLSIFLLEMGMATAKKLGAMRSFGAMPWLFALFVPLFNGVVMAYGSGFFLEDEGNRFILAVLSASASYIAVPAAMKMAAPKANPGLYIPMALGISFPFNLSLGMPIYWLILS